MKSTAIATALLLHAAAIGTVVHLHSGQDATQSRALPFAITLVSSPGETTAITPAARKPELAPQSAATDQFLASNRLAKPQAMPDAAGDLPVHVNPATGNAVPSGLPSATTTIKTNASIPASYVDSNRKPVYPLLSRRQEEQGTVLLRIMVRADGTAGEIYVRRTSGYPLLDESALHAVQNWRFTPASINNKPVAEWYQIAIPFKLHN